VSRIGEKAPCIESTVEMIARIDERFTDVGSPVEAKHDISLQPMRNIALDETRIGRKLRIVVVESKRLPLTPTRFW
jgi:hypothetical protein